MPIQETSLQPIVMGHSWRVIQHEAGLRYIVAETVFEKHAHAVAVFAAATGGEYTVEPIPYADALDDHMHKLVRRSTAVHAPHEERDL